MTSKKETLEHAVVVLNSMLNSDTVAATSLFSSFVPAHVRMGSTPIEVFPIGANLVAVGTLGVINGIVGYSDTTHEYRVAARYREGTSLLELFVVDTIELPVDEVDSKQQELPT